MPAAAQGSFVVGARVLRYWDGSSSLGKEKSAHLAEWATIRGFHAHAKPACKAQAPALNPTEDFAPALQRRKQARAPQTTVTY